MTERAFPLVFAADVAATAEFYRRLGFTVDRQSPADGEPTYVGLRRGVAELAIVGTSWPRDLLGLEAGGPGVRFATVLMVADLDALLVTLRADGVRVLHEPLVMPWGERIAHVADPAGNPVALTAHAHDGSE
jgi:lactoylglutathione lyase